MKSQTIVILVLAILMGGAAVYAIAPMMREQDGAAAEQEMTQIVMAKADISRGAVIQPESVSLESVPKRGLNPKVVLKLEDVVGHVATIPMLEGEPVLSSKITEKGSGGGLAALIPKGMRAFTIQTPTVAAGVAGFVLPGNKVDVLLTMNESGRMREYGGGTTTLLENIEILAADQRIDRESSEKAGPAKELRSVTLLVTPDQAKKLDLAQNLGNLHLALRNPEDGESTHPARLTTISELQLTNPQTVRTETPPAPTPTPPPPPPTPVQNTTARQEPTPTPIRIRTLRGTQEGVVQVYHFGPPGQR